MVVPGVANASRGEARPPPLPMWGARKRLASRGAPPGVRVKASVIGQASRGHRLVVPGGLVVAVAVVGAFVVLWRKQFTSPPVGPLGAMVMLKEEGKRFAVPIEHTLKNCLTSFVVVCQQ